MNTIYRYKKRVARKMTGFTHTLPILIEYAWSMARVWLEYGYSMARVWLEHSYTRRTEGQPPCTNEITVRSQRDYGSFSTRLRLVATLLLLLTLGSGSVCGQPSEGLYYIANYNNNNYNVGTPANNFYLVPAANPQQTNKCDAFYSADYGTDAGDPNQPFLATKKTNKDANSVWRVENVPGESGFYYIIHQQTGRYVIYEPVFSGDDSRRKSMHLKSTNTLGDEAKFEIIIAPSKPGYAIRPKLVASGNCYFNVAGGNSNNYYGTGSPGFYNGLVGLYSDPKDKNGVWCFEQATIDPPTITNNYSAENTFSITATDEATIYYTTDGSTPTTETTTKGTSSVTFDQTVSMTVIKAIAKAESDYFPTVVTTYYLPVCEKPAISVSGGTVTITCATAGAAIHYTTDGSPATASSTLYSGPFAKGDASTIRAVATKAGYVISSEGTLMPATEVSFSNEITDMMGNYILSAGFSSTESIGTSEAPFKGTIDGNMVTISGLNHPLVAYANDATIKNVILDNVNISGGTNVGSICAEATGDTRIYNCGVLATNSTVRTDEDGYTVITSCSSTISGSNYVGSIVGLLGGSSRVINCFSYANVNGGSEAGGIVGHNNVATTATNLKTMVMNCMFYGEVSGSSIAPIYNGEIITNVGENTGVSNFNYFRLESSYIQDTEITKVYNCALGAETRFLQRFEFYRHLLNSHRELAAWWATGSMDDKDEMMKWVLEPSQIGTSTPYPILKVPGKYPSVVNYDAENAPTTTERNMGGKLSTLSVTIQSGSGKVFGAPTGASITKSSLTLNITDKDPEHFNFNYYKVQLPYYNDVGTGNYTGNRVVTGWKIVSITGGTPGTYTESDSWGGYNFADRNCTNKDLYGTGGSNRVFSQGAYWDVPEGVTAITIEPYWAKAAYLADENADIVYNTDMSTPYKVPNVGGGKIYANGNSYSIADDSQTVYTSLGNAVTGLGITGTPTVNDYAVVLVGNYHHVVSNNGAVSGSSPYTVTSVDLDGDDEPDYSLMLRNNGRNPWHPVKWDFINIPGLGMAQKSTGSTAVGSYNLGIVVPTNWFETTNTALFRVTQFEYERNGNHTSAPYILQGGVMEQWVTGQQDGNNSPKNITYFHVGGNVWFKEFHRGVHQDRTAYSNHPPVSVTGGDFDKFYLTGMYRADVTSYGDNAECYINGGRFGEVAGAAMEGIGKANGADNTGNITWQIQNADIKEFYGGGLNADRPVTGNISTTITGGKIDLFCGGPKFGDMSTGKTVTTTATGCEFGTFFGAGYGGSSYSRRAPRNIVNMINMPATTGDSKAYDSWNAWVKAEYKQASATNFPGISTRFDYQFIPNSGNADNVGRLFVEHVLFSLATTYNVTSTLTNCKITGNFYGGGSLGLVDGPVTSTLTNCNVIGNVFGAGYSASLPTVEVDSIGFRVEPYYYTDLGTYRTGVKGKTVTYQWQHGNSIAIDTEKKILYTTENLDGLGAVTGSVTLTIDGNTTITDGKVMTIGKNVYGGGEESDVEGNTTVIVNGGTIGTGIAGTGNVFGAGKGLETNYEAALVKGNSTVTMSNGTVKGNIYGGGELSSVGTFTRADAAYHTAHPTVEVGTVLNYTSGGTTTVTISGGTVGNESEYSYSSDSRLAHTNGGNVFAGCKGVLKKSDDSYLTDWIKFARVKNTVLTVSGENTRIMSSIYGGGEIGSVGYLDESGALVEGCGTSVTVSSGTIGTEIKNNDKTQYTFGSVFGGGYGSDLETMTAGQTDPNAPKLFAGRIYGNTSVTMADGAVKASVYGGGELASVSGNAIVEVSGGSVGIDKVGDKQFGGPTMGNVYGGGSGNKNIVRAGQIFGNTNVNISQAESKTTRIYHNVYGGGAYGSVGTFEYHYTYEADGYEGIAKVDGITSCADNTGMATVTITGGTIGADGKENGMIFGSSRGDVGAPGSRDDLVAWVNTTNVTIGDASSSAEDQGPTIKGSVYGSGENGHTLSNAVVTVEKGTIGIHDGTAADGTRGNVYGSGCGTDKYYEDPAEETYDGNGQLYNPKAGIVQGTATVTINGGYVLHNVYGAGAMGPVGIDGEGHKTTVNINGGRIGYDGTDNGNVYGGARGAQGIGRNFAYVGDTEVNVNYATTPNADNNEKTVQLIAGSVFGGGEAGSVHGIVVVNMNQGLVLNDVYGGGALADTNTDNWGTDTWAEGKTAASNTTFVHLKGGTVTGNVYGGGLGKMAVGEKGKTGYEPAIEAKVYGNTTVELNKTVADDAKGCIVKGSIFGCNNMSGSPQASTTVHIYKTQRNGASRITNTTEVTNAKVKGIKTDGEYDPSSFDIQAVYGGGNLAAYEPVDQTNGTTNVIIDGCERTSICQVYGGGNAASTPATTVTINGTFEIGELFGGGNGKDDIVKNNVTLPNPGANVGYKDYSEYYKDDNDNWIVKDKEDADTKEERTGSAYEYGTGVAAVNVFGGLVHRVFGGSNTKGNVRQTALTLMDENNECPFCVDEAYGGGKEAEMDAEGKLLMACIPGLDAVYGGAEAADVKGGVELNITNGTFGRVFGGNNISGTICGPIKVNIKEVGCKPIIIGELYGGGNQAAYSIYGYDSDNKPIESGSDPWDDPEVNVTSFTSIGEIYGGGYGRRAVMVGNPKVSISEAIGTPDTYPTTGDFDETGFKGKTFTFDVGKETEHTVTCPPHVKGKIGVINKVFGGGNAAQVNGNTYVNIGTTVGDVIYEEVEVKVGVTVVTGYYTCSGAGTAESPYTYAVASADAETCDADGKAVTGMSYYRKLAIIGVDIRGNVYGGGNNAVVTGDSKVKIGKKNE